MRDQTLPDGKQLQFIQEFWNWNHHDRARKWSEVSELKIAIDLSQKVWITDFIYSIGTICMILLGRFNFRDCPMPISNWEYRLKVSANRPCNLQGCRISSRQNTRPQKLTKNDFEASFLRKPIKFITFKHATNLDRVCIPSRLKKNKNSHRKCVGGL